MPIEQDFLIFIGRIDFAPCDGEIGSLAIVYQVAKFDDAACAGKERQGGSRPQVKSNESPMTHKLNSPQEWLLEKAQHWNTDALYKALSGLAYRLDGQAISDLFHSEMDSDGFFDNKRKSNAEALDAESWGSHRWHT